MDSSMVLLGQYVDLKITKELFTMATKEFQSVTVPSGMIAQIYGPVGKYQSG